MGKEKLELSGRRFGKLVVLSSVGTKRGRTQWLCRCDCGNSCTKIGTKLTLGQAVSCGCQRGGTKHGHLRDARTVGKSPTYISYSSMISRCTQPSNPAYEHYRKSGVTVCDRWLSGEGPKGGFECFLEDMGERPNLRHSIDRHPNKSGNYEPKNCRWATKTEQANNRSTNITYNYRGTEVSIADLSRLVGIPYETLKSRLRRQGWSLEKAITTPVPSRSG